MDAAYVLLVLVVAGANIDSQTEAAVGKQHTAHFAGQSGWSLDQSNPPPAAAPMGDRYQFGASGGNATVSPPPNVVDRGRAAVIESGNALRDGVEAGIESANQQLYQGGEQVIDTARSAGQDLSKQFQGWAGTTSQQVQAAAPGITGTPPAATSGRTQVSNPFATPAPAAGAVTTAKTRSGVAPPPWAGANSVVESNWPSAAAASTTSTATETPRTASVGRAPVRTESGWTSVHSSVAPPRLAPPKLVNTVDTQSPLTTGAASQPPLQPLVGSGPNFPATIAANQPVDHSVLASPSVRQPAQQPPATESDNWDFGWDGKAAAPSTQQATIGNRYGAAGISAGSDVQERGSVVQQPTSSPPAQPVTPAPVASAQTHGSPPTTAFDLGTFDKDGWPQRSAAQQTGAMVGNGGAPLTMDSTMAAPPTNGTHDGMLSAGGNPLGATAPAVGVPHGDELPWIPLVVVSLALAGSIGANLFLGYSYADARHKYRTLVQKTANKFRRSTAA